MAKSRPLLVSPGVDINETDLTNIIPALSTSIGGYAGYFNWGPGGDTVIISSEADLVETYGAPYESGDPTEASFYTALSYLKYSNNLKVSRAIPDDSYNAISEDFSVRPEEYLDSISNREQLDAYGQANTVYGRYPGSRANGLEVYFIDSGVYNASPSEIPTEVAQSLAFVPNTTEWAKDVVDPEGDLNSGDPSLPQDEVHVVIVDGEGTFSGKVGAILEVHSGLSIAYNGKNQYGEGNYYINVVNNRSNYIWIGPEDIGNEQTITPTNTTITSPFTGGEHVKVLSDGTDGDRTKAGPILAALDLFADVEFIDVTLLFAQNFYSSPTTPYLDTPQFQIDDKIREIVENRCDCIGFISAPLSTKDRATADQKVDHVLEKMDQVPSSSYIVLDSTPAYVYNRYRDAYVWIPLCGHMAGLCARTDGVTEPWFSPAGVTRGVLQGITKLALNPNQAQRDELYTNRVNPVVSFPGQGILLYGDKTAQAKPSAFDRINVRRLFTTIEKAISTAAKFQLFELNDEFTRASFRNAVEPYLRGVQGRRGITDFRVVCDESNNTPDVIDTNRFVADIYIQPARSINFIYLNFIATRTGATFIEAVGR